MPQENEVYDWNRKFLQWRVEVENALHTSRPPTSLAEKHIGAALDIVEGASY